MYWVCFPSMGRGVGVGVGSGVGVGEGVGVAVACRVAVGEGVGSISSPGEQAASRQMAHKSRTSFRVGLEFVILTSINLILPVNNSC